MALIQELDLIYSFIRGDLTTTLIPSSLTLLVAYQSSTSIDYVVPPFFFLRLLFAPIIFTLYILTFCILNQVAGIKEDKINKPHRPIPSGKISIDNAMSRYYVYSTIYLVLALALNVEIWALAWLVLSYLYNLGGLDKHWLTKNFIFITLGTIFQLCQAFEIIKVLNGEAWTWILFISVSFGATLNLQDFRDIEGDRAQGRWTLPMATEYYREITAGMLFVLPLFTYFMISNVQPNYWIEALEWILMLNNCLVAFHILKFDDPKNDHRAYIIHTLWFAGIILLWLLASN